LFIASIPLIIRDTSEETLFISNLFGNPGFLFVLVFILSLLLVAPIKLFSLKFQSFGWKGNESRYLFLTVTLFAMIILQFTAIPLLIVFYIILSLTTYSKKNEIPR
jgi:CDP-diacylglycerol---serine O-phosphatidyltransferase